MRHPGLQHIPVTDTRTVDRKWNDQRSLTQLETSPIALGATTFGRTMPPTSHRGVGCVNVVEIAGAGGDSEEILARAVVPGEGDRPSAVVPRVELAVKEQPATPISTTLAQTRKGAQRKTGFPGLPRALRIPELQNIPIKRQYSPRSRHSRHHVPQYPTDTGSKQRPQCADPGWLSG